ncbi:MAG: hypothetical protein NC320_06445 [Clostridium sp.]|nr:hypothetical protein [Clostridium sp.]
MGILGAINKAFGYSEENMMKQLNEILAYLGTEAECPISVSLKTKTLLSSKAYASGFATITGGNVLLLRTVMPVNGAGLYDISTPKKLIIKENMFGHTVIEGKFLDIKAKDYESLIMEAAPKVDGFPNQEYNLNRFIDIIDQYKTR